MTEVQGLIETDRLATLSVNGSDSIFLDGVADIYTSVFIWIPLALMAIFLIIRNIKPNRIVLVLAMIVVTVVLCDQLSSSVFKPLFHRFRPTRDLFIMDMIDTVNGYRGGLYGFFSGHAANSFGLAVLFMWLVRDAWFSISIGIWAALNSLIRTYLGVHFVGDILVGAIAGSIIGTSVYFIYRFLIRRDRTQNMTFRDSRLMYTSSGFRKSDIFLFLAVLFATYSVILTGSCITQGLA